MDDATLGQFADNAVSLFWEARGTAMGTVISAYQDMAEGADAIEKILKDAAG